MGILHWVITVGQSLYHKKKNYFNRIQYLQYKNCFLNNDKLYHNIYVYNMFLYMDDSKLEQNIRIHIYIYMAIFDEI